MRRKTLQDKIIIFTKMPVPGKTKTRLIPLLGIEGAADLHKEMAENVVDLVHQFCRQSDVMLEIRYVHGKVREMESWLGKDHSYKEQGGGDLGARMKRALQESLEEGSKRVLIVGTDCPEIDSTLLRKALDSLKDHPAVIGPAADGGYYLIGLNKMIPAVFEDVEWGTENVFTETLERLHESGFEAVILKTLHDIDRPDDYECWAKERRKRDQKIMSPYLSIIIPVLNEEQSIGRTLHSAIKYSGAEILVVDGGSSDRTPEIVKAFPVTFLETDNSGRAHQMNLGARQAQGKILLFLHGDTVLPGSYEGPIREALSLPGVSAGAFQFGLDESFRGSSINTCFANLRSKLLHLPYGDQGLFLKRELFEKLGGFKEMPILEDVDMVRRLRRQGKILILPEKIRTSARRWKRLGYLRTFFTNQLIMLAFALGVSPERMARWYRKADPGKQ